MPRPVMIVKTKFEVVNLVRTNVNLYEVDVEFERECEVARKTPPKRRAMQKIRLRKGLHECTGYPTNL